MVSEDLRYTFYALRRGQFMSEASNTALDWLKESLSEMWERRSGLPARLAAMGSFDRDTMAKAFKSFRSTTEALVAADGHFMEKVPLPIYFYFDKIG
jgi:hypothetical protein